jgi:hypothetical protein
VDTNNLQMTVNYRSPIYDAISAINDITESKQAFNDKFVLFSFFIVVDRCSFNTKC